jgi:hypothetical protein
VVDNPKEWFPVTVSKNETKYLENLKVKVSVNSNDVEPSNSKLTPIASIRSNSITSKNDVTDSSFRRNKLPNILNTSGIVAPLRVASEANISSVRRLAPLTPDVLSPRSSRLKLGDVDASWTESTKTMINSLIPSPKNVKKIKLAKGGSEKKMKSTPELKERTLETEGELKETENVAVGITEGGDSNDMNTDLTRLVRDNLIYDADIRTYSCQICGEIADESHSVEQLEEHVLRCVTRKELQIRFNDINNSLEPELSLMSESNSLQMAAFISKAMTMFEKRSALNNEALSLIRRVLDIPYYASDGKWLSSLCDEISGLKNDLRDDLNEHRLTVADSGSDRDQYEDMKTVYRILQAGIMQINAKRSALRKFNQYIMDVNHFTFLRQLSKGAFSTVYLAKRKDNGKHCAIKMMNKEFIREKDMVSQVLRERSILSSIVTSKTKVSLSLNIYKYIDVYVYTYIHIYI